MIRNPNRPSAMPTDEFSAAGDAAERARLERQMREGERLRQVYSAGYRSAPSRFAMSPQERASLTEGANSQWADPAYSGQDIAPRFDERGMRIGSPEQLEYERALRSPYRSPPTPGSAQYTSARAAAYANSPHADALSSVYGDEYIPLPGSFDPAGLAAPSTDFATPRRPEQLPKPGWFRDEFLADVTSYSGSGPERLAMVGGPLYRDGVMPPVRTTAADDAINQLRADQTRAAREARDAGMAARGVGIAVDPSLRGRLTERYFRTEKPVALDPSLPGRNAAARIEFRDLPTADPRVTLPQQRNDDLSLRARAVPLPSGTGPMGGALQAARNEVVPRPRLRPAELRSAAPTAPTAPAQAGRVKVRRGQTLSEIAQANGTTLRALMQANGIKDANKLRAGVTLRIPARKKKRT